jgi:hypothetical protein
MQSVLGERLVLDADPDPDDERQALFEKKLQSAVVATVTWMIQVTW